MEDKSWTVYQIVDTRTNEVIYVGQTMDFDTRKYHHFQQKNRPVDIYMYEQGRENFSMLPYKEDILTVDEAVSLEDKIICELHPIMNKQRSGFIAKSDPVKYHREYNKELYTNNREQVCAYQREWRAAHREQVREYMRKVRLRKKLEKSSTIVLF